jgi:hypothetical protein
LGNVKEMVFMLELCSFEEGFFDLQAIAPPPACTAQGVYVYVGYLNGEQVRVPYYCGTESSVVNIGGTTGAIPPLAPHLRLANNKRQTYQRISDAWACQRCPRSRVSYRVVPNLNNGGFCFLQIAKPEKAFQFIFGFAAGALPICDRGQKGLPIRKAYFSDLHSVAMAAATGGVQWARIFPNCNEIFYQRLQALLEAVEKIDLSTVPAQTQIGLNGTLFSPNEPQWREVRFEKEVPPQGAPFVSAIAYGPKAGARALADLVRWIDAQL